MAKAIVVDKPGEPDVLKLEEVAVAEPGPGEIKIRQTAAGVNFIDINFRKGLYQPALVPGLRAGAFIPGQEGVGRVTSAGDGVRGLKVGDRVAYANGPMGAYADERVIPADRVIKVPDQFSDQQVAGMMVRGLTAWYLLHSLRELKPGEMVLFHAAAGGVGLIFCQWARHLGLTVVGTVGSPEKAAQAKAAGCHHVILYKQEDWVAKVRETTKGQGVSVVYDAVGRDTFAGSLDCLKRRGLMVSFGVASGPVTPFEPTLLGNKGSVFLTRPRLADYLHAREDYERGANELFAVAGTGAVKIEVGQSYPLGEAAQAHADLAGRKTTGSTILTM
jgi:NADPH2:quinone reductase